jgi:methionyl aminopeptidase
MKTQNNGSTIYLKTSEEIEKMRVACRLAADVLDMVTPYVQAGISTEELDKICHEYIVHVQKAIPAPLNYRGFPKSICTSVNHQICHGVPNSKRLKDKDIINIDITVIKEGYHGDTSKMFCIGEPSIRAKRLIETTYECLWVGIKQVRPWVDLNVVGQAIQKLAESRHFSVVQEYCGHGIGRAFHEAPQVLHYNDVKNIGVILKPGMIFTIEPMINAGKRYIKLLPDKWTVVTKDHSLSAQWEHTVLVTENGYDVLTKREEDNRFE